MFDALPDLGPLWLSLKLAAVTVVVLLLITTPLAWWLARSDGRLKVIVESLVALPLVLPPTVLGFYLLILLGPQGWLGGAWVELSGESLAFSFSGLVIASVLYSLPFVVQPLQNAFAEVSDALLEAAWTLGASPRDAFFSIVCPLALPGFITATVLGFAHTLGEFGVVLMVGGNIPGETRVISIAIYDHVEMMSYSEAHLLSALLLGFSFISLLLLYAFNKQRWGNHRAA